MWGERKERIHHSRLLHSITHEDHVAVDKGFLEDRAGSCSFRLSKKKNRPDLIPWTHHNTQYNNTRAVLGMRACSIARAGANQRNDRTRAGKYHLDRSICRALNPKNPLISRRRLMANNPMFLLAQSLEAERRNGDMGRSGCYQLVLP